MELYEPEAELYRALGDPIRLRILALLRVRSACVCELVERLPVSQPAVSQHLRKLRYAGIVTERRQKYWNYYAISDDLPPLVAEVVRMLPRDENDEKYLREHQVDAICGVLATEDEDGIRKEEGAMVHGR